MFRRVCTIEPLFFNTTLGMHRRPFEGRHLVLYCDAYQVPILLYLNPIKKTHPTKQINVFLWFLY